LWGRGDWGWGWGEIFFGIARAPHGRSGGMLLGVDQQQFDIGSIDEGDHYIKFQLCNKSDGFKWALVAVYGPAQANHKETFGDTPMERWQGKIHRVRRYLRGCEKI
jgi:hypothetical protein